MALEIHSEDIISTLKAQRNAALDEIAQMSAIIRALERRVKAAEDQQSPDPSPPSE